jgi:plasmid stabilization system protein ParE
MGKFWLSPEAASDLDEIQSRIAAESPRAADRVLESACATIRRLAVNPGLGHPWKFRRPGLVGLRAKQVDKFRNYLIFHGGLFRYSSATAANVQIRRPTPPEKPPSPPGTSNPPIGLEKAASTWSSVSAFLIQNHPRPARQVQAWCFGEAQKQIAYARIGEDAGIEDDGKISLHFPRRKAPRPTLLRW